MQIGLNLSSIRPGQRSRRGRVMSGVNTPQDSGEAVFLNEGTYWTIRFGEQVIRMQDRKGLH